MLKKLDIIIPTKNRYSTLVPAVRAILSRLKSQEYRILIYDNTPESARQGAPQLPQDPRVTYHHDPQDIDAVENFNRAIDLAQSEFSILIGDDDLVLPSVFEAISKMEHLDLDCLIQQRPTYYWPGVKFNREIDYFSSKSLLITKEIASTVIELDPIKELNNVLDRGAIYLFNLPAFYHGLVRTQILKQIRKKYGAYVLGPSPDISLALLIAHSIRKYGMYLTPFSVAGASFNSAAGMGRRGQHSATLDRAPEWLPREMLNKWDPALPKIWNGFTVYAQSLYLVGKYTSIPISINYEALYKKMLSDNFWDIKYMSGENAPMSSPKLITIIIGFLRYILRFAIMHMPKVILNIMIRRHPAFRFQVFYTDILDPEACIIKAESHISRYAI
jgi:glycosyltransferase involved in cell wall biosynthesis